MQHVLLVRGKGTGSVDTEILKAVQREISPNVKKIQKIEVSATLPNKFEENPKIISGAFPTLFPLCISKDVICGTATMRSDITEHLLTMDDQRLTRSRDQCVEHERVFCNIMCDCHAA